MERIQIIITGGTFDKKYNELNGELYFKETHLHEMLQLGRSRLSVEVNPLMLIDSLQMDRSHREKILAACEKAAAEKIVITHGTDTMVATATFLAKKTFKKQSF